MEHKIDLENEIWKVWKDTRYSSRGHLYEVSDQGRAKVDGVIFEFDETSPNYYRLPCHDHLHRAVAILHVPNPENKKYVDHINCDIHDNRACNLRWVTAKENSNNPITRSHLEEYWHSADFSVSITNRNLERWSAEENRKEMSSKMKDYWESESGKQRKEQGFNYIHLGDKTKIVTDEYLDYWLDDGWLYGCGKRNNNNGLQGARWMSLGNKSELVKQQNIERYLSEGWEFGRTNLR